MKYLTAALLLAALVAGPSQAQDGPFGLNMGEDPAKYGCALSGDSDFFHFCENVPKPHPDVKSYGVWSYPETGIAFIIGMGDTHENDRYGSSVRAEIDRIARQIASKYGDWTDYSDWIAQSSSWTDSNEWAASVNQGDRFYYYFWDFEDNEELGKIEVSVQTTRLHNTYFTIKIEFKNIEQFDAARENRGADVF